MAPVGNSNSSPSQPIPIEGHHGRRRSESVSESSESSASPTTPYSMGTPFPTPATGYPPRIASLTPSSPILSYFLSQPSPTAKSPTNTFPMRRNLGPPVIEDDEATESQAATPTKHGRRASTAWSGSERFAQPPVPAPTEQHDRAAGMLRRLSLGGALGRPQLPPNFKQSGGANTQTERGASPQRASAAAAGQVPRKPRRANTISPGTPRPPRAPSPMGERILKGHFDGFN